ncbi:MAG: hypothetical protein KAG66_18045, partial [Methylococcales bacterium]|nr:hypothetical protein [Methylococcales bacterium]
MAELKLGKDYKNRLSVGNKVARIAWTLVSTLLFLPTPRWCMFKWRVCLLQLFGAKVHGSFVRPSCRIWAPWNLEVGEGSALDEEVYCYSVAPIRIGSSAVISREVFLCTA